jgi:hypothetical protein
MWRYLKAAFFTGVDVRGLGRVPVNALAVAAVGIFGFIEPSIWLAGLGLEAAFLSSLAFSPRFQKLTDGAEALRGLADEAAQVSALVAALPPELHQRLTTLQKSSARVLTIYRTLGLEAAATDTTRDSLDRLEWIYLKLLVARNHLTNELGQERLPELTSRIARMEATTALDRSQEATLAILRRRAENLSSRDRLLQENQSDLERIEAQVELMRENAAIEGKPVAADMEIELASDLGSPEIFGTQSSLVRSLDGRRRLV